MIETGAAPRLRRRPRPMPRMPESDDASLLQRIARAKDSAAFEAFYARYGTLAYNLARYLTGDSALAEDAVQEAMTSVWRSAGTYDARASENARSWTLRIVANACGRLKRQRTRKRESSMVPSELRAATNSARSPEQAAEREELLAALRASYARLAEDDRHLVALYYGAGLTCDQIAADGAIPARTVAYRIQKAIEHLRANLTRTGFAAAVPLVSTGKMGEALTTGFAPPSALRERVMKQAGRADPTTVAEQSRRGAATGGKSTIAVLLIGILVYGMAGWWAMQSDGKAQDPSTSKSDLEAAVPPDHGRSTGKPIHRVWNFSKGPSDDLKVVMGEWEWVPTEGKRPAGMLSTEGKSLTTLVRIQMEMPLDRWYVVRMCGFFLGGKSGRGKMHATWAVKVQPKTYTRYRSEWDLSPLGEKMTVTYLMGDWETVCYSNPAGTRREGTLIYHHGPDAKRYTHVLLDFTNYLVEEVELREVTPDELPELYRDPERTIRELKLEAKTFTRVFLKEGDGESESPQQD